MAYLAGVSVILGFGEVVGEEHTGIVKTLHFSRLKEK